MCDCVVCLDLCIWRCPGEILSVSVLYLLVGSRPAESQVGGSWVQERQEGRGEVGEFGPPIPHGRAGGGVPGAQALWPLLTAARPPTHRPSQPRRGLLPRSHRALPQLQRAPVRRAQPAPALPRLADRRGPEQLLHLDGEDPSRAW